MTSISQSCLKLNLRGEKKSTFLYLFTQNLFVNVCECVHLFHMPFMLGSITLQLDPLDSRGRESIFSLFFY